MPKFIIVTSRAAGVGKTLISMMLASALQRPITTSNVNRTAW